jgi:hypothetical protein
MTNPPPPLASRRPLPNHESYSSEPKETTMLNRSIFLTVAMFATLPAAFSQAIDAIHTTPVAATAATVIPALVRYQGADAQSSGKSEKPVTFLIFKDETGGEPLWVETQTISFDPAGKYEAYLGATYSSGLPSGLFGTGEARWLEVQISGETPAPRTLLTSVPYALKAADAATLGGLPASAFALAGTTGLAAATANGITPDATASNVTTTGGTSHYVPVFTGASTVANSEIYDTGSSVGIGDVPTAGAKLDVNGAMILRGNMTVFHTGNATASKAYPSYGLEFYSNVYNSSTKVVDSPYFQLQSEPTSNNTASPSATLNLLFANNGKAVAETGLYFNPDGTIHFAPTQTFPSTSSTGTALTGTSGSGTGVQGTSTSATGVAGTSTTGNGMLGFTSGGTVNTAGVLGGAGGPSGFGGIAGVWGDAYSHVGVLGTSQLYAGVQGISNYGQGVQGQSTSGYGVQGTSTSSYGVSGTSSTSDGVIGSTGGTSLYTAGVLGSAGARTSFQAIAGVWGDAAAHVGVFGSSSQYAGVAGQSTQGQGVQGSSVSGVGVQGSSTSANGVYGFSSNTSGVHGETQSTSSADAAVYGFSDTSAMGVYGGSNGGPGVVGATASNIGVKGTASTSGTAIVGTAQAGSAGLFTNTSATIPALMGVTYGGGPNASAVAVYGDSAQSSGIGVEGNTLSGIGVYATTNAQSTGFQRSNFGGPVALWADSSPPNGDGAGIAIIATANSNNAAYFTNNSDLSTLYTVNYGSGNTGDDVFATLEAASPKGVCGFGGNGDLTCTGRMKSLATTGNGARTVETYSMQSPENWMEDFGAGTLRNGVATVSIDAAFAETVSGTSDYHVFLTPQGDSKGLYVANKTAASFEVHESGGGTATIGFDYRIVAKRRGYEAQRMVDVTEAMKTVKTRNDLQTERYKKASKQ